MVERAHSHEMRATLRKPLVSLPRLRLGHITGGYTLGLTPCPTRHSPIGERRISARTLAEIPSRACL